MADSRGTTTASDDDGSGVAATPPAARGGATASISIVLLVLLVASIAAFLMLSPADDKLRMEGAGGVGSSAAGAEPVEHAVVHGIPGFNSRLDAFRTWAKLAWMKLRRPRSDEPRYNDAGGSPCSVTGAAKKSLEMGKETVEQSAATAARAVEGAAGKAKDKVKGAAAPPSDAEL